ncbi:DUF3370 domain-containing protein [Leptolyngbya sp. FACHB-671]|uniref:DUF3370 domain-containing protein n=1 Tax=Leptolyngbya sp. FACHB-671 TaxID=2692812 RepID=UPI0016866E2F|nr:DUF3370 domain-containing protein [Leptolyngbya sp. FACHB-671]MBD2070689.1 DUF3370 domain-containing protein [Leptolyngbya sp. FACHB-671]
MFAFLLTLAQATPTPTPPPPPEPQEFVRPQEVRSLPGGLDQIPMFNSNSPELVQTEGILLSTFPAEGMEQPAAHLNFPFEGRFDLFAHHVYRALSPEELTSLYLGVIVHNPGSQPVAVDVLQAATYLSQPDAPFIDLPALVENPLGEVYAGPGGRVMNDILRGQRQEGFLPQVIVPPGGYEMLLNVPIPVEMLDPPINGRSTLMRLRSDGRVYVASLALFAREDETGNEQAPTLDEWRSLLQTGSLAGARDRTPTPPDQTGGQVVYGRVAGVAQGSVWEAQVADSPDAPTLSIPAPGEAFSYGLSTLVAGRLGTNQVQTAPMLVRYPDTAYQAHGNYAIQYSLSLPLHNPTDQTQQVAIALQTPIKEDLLSQNGLRFFEPLPTQTFFRGTVRVRYTDDRGLPRTRYIHVVQRRGQQGEPLVTLEMPEGDRRLVQVDFLYPPDSTPPQVLTVQTLERTDSN